jgi:hypothetical protein
LDYLKHLRWFHSLPIFHLCGCFTGFIGYLIPSLHHWGILFTFILILDLPISLVAYLNRMEIRRTCFGLDYGGWHGICWGGELNFCLIHSSVVLDRLLFSCPTQKSAQQTTTSPDQGANQTCAAILRNTRDKRI